MSVLPPSADIPRSSNTCEVALIDTTTDILVHSLALIQPEIQGHEFLNLPTFAFYIANPRLGQRVLFDMGSRKDWWNLPPHVVDALNTKGVPGIRVKNGIDEVLSSGGIDPATIDAVVWSHYHWDHTGNIQLFPSSTAAVVAQGFQESFLPGCPADTSSPFYGDDFKGRRIHEIAFDGEGSLQIGRFQAYDYFGDQSFYLLHTPGHTAGHISGLVRTTENSFIFLGGDISHFPGTYRPTNKVPLPETIPPTTILDARIRHPCPCSLFTACHPGGDAKARTTPYYTPSTGPESWYDDAVEAQRSIEAMKDFDADEHILVAIAHDPGLRDLGLRFPQSSMNNWRAEGWKDRLHWNFLNELPLDGKAGRPPLVEGN